MASPGPTTSQFEAFTTNTAYARTMVDAARGTRETLKPVTDAINWIDRIALAVAAVLDTGE